MTEEIIIDVNGCPHKSDDDCMEVPICNEYGDLMGYQSCEAQTLCPYRSQKKIKRLEQENNSLQAQLNNITVQSNNDITALEQENKSLYEEKNCLHKIIDRLLENAGYSKDIASAEDFEDVYEDMQRKVNELAELEQENRELKEEIQFHNKENSNLLAERNAAQIGYDEIREVKEHYRSALEEIRTYLKTLSSIDSDFPNTETYLRITNVINEVLNS